MTNYYAVSYHTCEKIQRNSYTCVDSPLWYAIAGPVASRDKADDIARTKICAGGPEGLTQTELRNITIIPESRLKRYHLKPEDFAQSSDYVGEDPYNPLELDSFWEE